MNRNRESILELINTSTEHPTAEQIYMKLKNNSQKIVLSTVYNNLSHLQAQGLIRKVSIEGCPDRYDKTIRHDHLVCKKCGKLTDVFLKDITSELQSQIEHALLSYDLKISYICPACQMNEKQ